LELNEKNIDGKYPPSIAILNNNDEIIKLLINYAQFYIVITENGSVDGKNKREEKEQFLDALVTEINNLVIGNKDTYNDQSILKKLEEAPVPKTSFNKRNVIRNENDNDDDGVKEPENKFAYVVSSLDKESVISTCLSDDLVPLVEELPYVKPVMPDFKIDFYSRKSLLEEIKRLINANILV